MFFYITIKKIPTKVGIFGDPKQNRTAHSAVKGRCLNRLTMGPYIIWRIIDWWRWVDSNHWPYGYEPYALANWATPPYKLLAYYTYIKQLCQHFFAKNFKKLYAYQIQKQTKKFLLLFIPPIAKFNSNKAHSRYYHKIIINNLFNFTIYK